MCAYRRPSPHERNARTHREKLAGEPDLELRPQECPLIQWDTDTRDAGQRPGCDRPLRALKAQTAENAAGIESAVARKLTPPLHAERSE
jgi:hypothetical protein